MGQGSLAAAASFLVLAVVRPAEASLPSHGAAALPETRPRAGLHEVMECQHSPLYKPFFDQVASKGWRNPEVFTLAYNIWENLDLQAIEERETSSSSSSSSSSSGQFPWRTTLQIGPGVGDWLLRQIQLFGEILGTGSTKDKGIGHFETEGHLLPTDCPYGFLLLQYALLVGCQIGGMEENREDISNSLVACMEVILDAPYSTFDFMESSLWNVSSRDVSVNLDTSTHYQSYADYEKQRPVPLPLLPPWHAADEGTAPLPRGDLQAAFLALARRGLRPSTAAQGAGSDLKLSLAMLQLHDGTASELWASAKAAFNSLASYQSAYLGQEDALQLQLYFTQVKALRGTEKGDWLAQRTHAEFHRLKEIIVAGKEGKISLQEIRDDWLLREAPGLGTADLVLCSEPFWLCPLLASKRTGLMVGVLHMALLNEFPFRDEENQRLLWSDFKAMMDRRSMSLSVACRLTGEIVLHQTGWRVPYVPFIGLGVGARYFPGEQRKALLFRNNRQNMISFRAALRMFTSSAIPPWPVQVVDMNEAGVLTFEEIAEFHAVVLLPHGPNALRLSDLYAAAIPMVIPEEPFVHKFVWASRTFGGYDAEPYYNARAPEDLRRLGGQTSDSSVFGKHPPFHPTNLLQAWMMHRFMDDRRYWYQYTEWATLPHLLRFSSLASLMERLSALTREEGRRVSALMANHHAVMVADALGWWRAALSDLITDLDLRQ